jgi:hypothetical protein
VSAAADRERIETVTTIEVDPLADDEPVERLKKQYGIVLDMPDSASARKFAEQLEAHLEAIAATRDAINTSGFDRDLQELPWQQDRRE